MGRLRGLLLICLAAPAAGAAIAAPERSAADTLRAEASFSPRDTAAAIALRPGPLAADPLDRIWMLDASRGRIARVGDDGLARSVSLVPAGEGRSLAPVDLAASGSYLYALEAAAGSVALVDLDGEVRDRIALAAGLAQAGAEGFLPSRILVGRSGDLWLLESRLGGILHFDRRMRFLGRPLDGAAGVDRPARIADWALTSDDGLLLLDAERGRIVPLDPFGAALPVEDLGGPLRGSSSLAVDAADRRFVLEAGGRLRVLLPGGAVAAERVLVPSPGPAAVRMLVTRDGILCVADPTRGTIDRWRIDAPPPADAAH